MTNGFDKLLRKSLDAASTSDTGECLDAALLAAWFDGTLTRAEHAAVEQHAAVCSRCQAMIAALVRTDRPAPRAMWHAPAMRWLVPLAVAAASLILVVAVLRPGRRAPSPAETSAARLEAPSLPVSVTPEPSAIGGAAGAAQDRTAGTRSADKPPQLATRAPRETTQRSSAATERSADADPRSRRAAVTAAPAPTAGPSKEEVRTAAAPPPPVSQGAMAKAAAPNSAAGVQAEAAPPAAPAPTAQSNMAGAADAAARPFARGVAESVVVAGRGGSRGTVISSPDRSVQWRIAGTGQVERSVDGMTWQTQTIEVSAVLTAGAAPSATVCWMVGFRGVVLRTADSGQTWTRIAFPEQVDLVTVVADDDKVATVTAAGGRQFHTTDGGKSWR